MHFHLYAFAVRERRGDPRVGPSFRCSFLPGMPSSPTPGSSITSVPEQPMSRWPSPEFQPARHPPKPPAIRFTRAWHPEASVVRTLLRPVRLLAPLNGSDRLAPAIGGFYVRASNGSVTLPVAGYDYSIDWTLCWRDLHPQEWQLASLHENRSSLNHSLLNPSLAWSRNR